MFSLGNLKTFIPVFRSKAQELSELFDKAIAKDDGVVESKYFSTTKTFCQRLTGIVIEACSRATLDIIGIFGLGVDLKNMSSEDSVFHECYHDVFEPGPAGMVLTAINAFVPIRWLPVKANRDFIRANGIVHSILGDIVKQRIEEVRTARERSSPNDKVSGEQESRDLLTFMVQEKYFGDDGDRWTEDDMLNQILNVVAGGRCYYHLGVWKVGARTANVK